MRGLDCHSLHELALWAVWASGLTLSRIYIASLVAAYIPYIKPALYLLPGKIWRY